MTTILDHHGNPIDTGTLREPQTEDAENKARVGWISREFDTHPGRGLTPARLSQIMVAAEKGDLIPQLDLADDMEERDAHLYSQLSTRKDAVVNLDWLIEPPKDATAEEQKLAEEVTEWIESIPEFEENVLRELLDGILKGFKAIEMWFELEDGVLMPRFASRPQRWFTLSEDRASINLRSDSAYGVPLKPYGWLMHQPRSRSGYPGRSGLCRVLAWPYLFKNYNTRDLAEFLEIYGLPVRMGKYPTGASDAEKRSLMQAVVGIGHNAAGIMPMGMEIEIKEAAKGTEGPFKTMADWMEALISKAILGQTLTSGEGQHGTQALGAVHDGVRMTICKSDAKRLSATVTTQLIHPWLLVNKPGLDRRRLPQFVIDVPEPEDLKLYAEALPKLASAGLRISVEDTHKRLRIPIAKDGEEILKGAPAPVAVPGQPGAPAPAPVPEPGQKGKAPLSTQLPADQVQRDAFDDLVADATADWRPVLEPLMAPLLAELDRAVLAGESLESFRARFPEMINLMDSRPQAERLARAAFLARLAGEADVDLEQP